MSETKRLDAPKRPTDAVGGQHIGGVLAYNENPYPVEVTVRRVAEKVGFEAKIETSNGDTWISGKDEYRGLRGKGYVEGQRVRVTVEPLD